VIHLISPYKTCFPVLVNPALMMEGVISFETLTHSQNTTRSDNPEDHRCSVILRKKKDVDVLRKKQKGNKITKRE
jgi:hypothetical protein